jgi:hypothetical protein
MDIASTTPAFAPPKTSCEVISPTRIRTKRVYPLYRSNTPYTV